MIWDGFPHRQQQPFDGNTSRALLRVTFPDLLVVSATVVAIWPRWRIRARSDSRLQTGITGSVTCSPVTPYRPLTVHYDFLTKFPFVVAYTLTRIIPVLILTDSSILTSIVETEVGRDVTESACISTNTGTVVRVQKVFTFMDPTRVTGAFINSVTF